MTTLRWKLLSGRLVPNQRTRKALRARSIRSSSTATRWIHGDSCFAPKRKASVASSSKRAMGTDLSLPRRCDLSVLALDLRNQELDERPPFIDLQIHQLAPRPVQMVGQE